MMANFAFLILGDKFESRTAFEGYADELQTFLLSLDPFSSRKNNIEFIHSTIPDAGCSGSGIIHTLGQGTEKKYRNIDRYNYTAVLLATLNISCHMIIILHNTESDSLVTMQTYAGDNAGRDIVIVGTENYNLEVNRNRLRTFAHELGHKFGLPDRYNQFYDGKGFSIMGGPNTECTDASNMRFNVEEQAVITAKLDAVIGAQASNKPEPPPVLLKKSYTLGLDPRFRCVCPWCGKIYAVTHLLRCRKKEGNFSYTLNVEET